MKKEVKEKSGKATLNMQLEPELLKQAKELAEKRGIITSGLVRMLLIQELEKTKAAQ